MARGARRAIVTKFCQTQKQHITKLAKRVKRPQKSKRAVERDENDEGDESDESDESEEIGESDEDDDDNDGLGFFPAWALTNLPRLFVHTSMIAEFGPEQLGARPAVGVQFMKGISQLIRNTWSPTTVRNTNKKLAADKSKSKSKGKGKGKMNEVGDDDDARLSHQLAPEHNDTFALLALTFGVGCFSKRNFWDKPPQPEAGCRHLPRRLPSHTSARRPKGPIFGDWRHILQYHYLRNLLRQPGRDTKAHLSGHLLA